MTPNQILLATGTSAILIGIVYSHIGWTNIRDCFKMWFSKEYWIHCNIVEASALLTKMIIVIPGLIFGIQLWWLYFLALLTSLALIWSSNKKLLPTNVGFNTMWVWLSCMVLFQSVRV